MNFHMFKLDLQKAEEPEIKLPTSSGSWKKQESSSKTSISALLCPSLHEIFPWLITEEGFLISSCYSLELCIQMLISFLFSFAFHLSSFHSYLYGLPRQPVCFLHFFSMGMVLIPVSCTMSRTSFHSSSGTLSIRSRPLNLFLTSSV